MRALATTLLLTLSTIVPAGAQIPAGPGQLPGTLPAAPAVTAPPPLAVPAPVPPASAGPPSVFQGTARSTSPVYSVPLSSGLRSTYRTRPANLPPKKKKKNTYRGSELLIVRSA
jgi:hypothetical protein